MTPTQSRLVARLADGALHSGETLAGELDVSRSAVWKIVGQLNALGIEVESTARRGYRLPRRVELLDPERIRKESRRLAEPGAKLDFEFSIDSTNERLYSRMPPPAGHWQVLLTELQTAGRGRRGRSWFAPFGAGLTLSMGRSFAEMPPDLSALGLAMGVCVLRAVHACGASDVRLKWPNDLVCNGRKLGGLLVQLRTESGGPAYVVVGLGLNLDLPDDSRSEIDGVSAWPAGDLREQLRDRMPGRNSLAAAIIDALADGLDAFADDGFGSFAADYAQWDALNGNAVRMEHGENVHQGIARGVDRDGALRVEVAGELRRFVAGDVSVRPGQAA